MKRKALNIFIQWHKKQYSHRQKIIALVIQGIFFLILSPIILFFISQKMDTFFDFQAISPSEVNFYLGLLLSLVGLSLVFWAVWVQFQIGQGTPVPMMPTQKLVVRAPYTYCRNPMGLGSGILLLGFGIIFNSLSFILVSTLLFLFLLLYYKFVEEKELIKRFGGEYLKYKNRTPFLIPTFRRKK